MFTNVEDFGKYVQGLEMSISLSALEPSITQARDEIVKSLGVDIIDNLLDTEAIAPRVKAAIANYAMYRYLIFWSTSKNNTDQSLYKYQYEAIKNEYISIFWSSMDAIFTWLDASNLAEWKESSVYTLRQSLLVKSALEFDRYFQIDKSEYFFSKVQFLISKITADDIEPRIKSLKEPSGRVLDISKRALCYKVMAQAVMLFDVTELPKSIRNDVAHEFTKESSLMQVREKIKSILMSDVEKYYSDLEAEVLAVTKNASLSSFVNQNEEKNNFYMSI